MEEIWKDVEDYEGYYAVSNFGNIRRIKGNKSNKNLKPRSCSTGHGYRPASIDLTVSGKSKSVRVSRLVAQAFIPNHENKPQVNHIDFNPQNNHISNLEWVTPKENFYHSFMANRYENSPVGSFHEVLKHIKKFPKKDTVSEYKEITRRFLAGEILFNRQ